MEGGEPSFATSEELAELRTEVAELRRHVLALQSMRGADDPLAALSKLRAAYQAMPPEAKALHSEAETEARALLR